jgi:putative ABC transport system permease protein
MSMYAILRDLRFGLRQLRLNRVFTIVSVLSLALGIGANTAIFQLIDAVRLRTLPVENPQELAYIEWTKGAMRSGWYSTRSARFTYALWEQLQARPEAFSKTMAWSATQFNMAQGGEARYAEGLYVSADFFSVLGVPAMMGRTFTAQDDLPACGSPGAVISYTFWQREFGAGADVLGRSVKLEARSFPVLGVTPPTFFGVEVGNRYDVALPICADPLFSEDGKGRIPKRGAWWLSAMGRLKPGWTIERANVHLQTLSPSIMEAAQPSYRPDDAKRFLANKLEVTSGAAGVSRLRRDYENPLWMLLATTGLVLLIACANLANLLLARASVREREIAVRQAIGASRGRLIAQLLSESMLLAVFGAALGALLAQGLSRGLVAFLTTRGNALVVGLQLDLRVFGFMVGVSILTCLLFGLAPAVRATSIAPASAMRSGGRGLTSGRERFGLRRALVVAQISLSLVLLVGALLFVRSLQKLLDISPGFRPEGIVGVSLDLRQAHYSKERLPEVYREILDRLRSRTGAVSTAQVGWTPVSGSGWDENTWADGSTVKPLDCMYNRAGPGYFKTMQTPVLAGRDFNERDNLAAPKVAIVNEVFVQRIFGGEKPVGRSFRVQGPAGKPDPLYQVVGVVRNTKYGELREDFKPIAFLPMAQDDNPGAGATFVLRTSAPLGGIFRAATAAVAEVHPGIGIRFSVLTMQLKESLMRDRLMAALAGAFGLLAGLLAVLGLYGVISYMVARRRNEIGVRIALGAGRGRVIQLVLKEAALLLAAGLVVGAGLALWAGRAASAMLYGLKPHDAATLGGAIGLLAVVALAASYGPAHRASRLEPMDALREE